MKLNFRVCEIDENNKLWKMVKSSNNKNEFIIVGEEKEYFKILQVGENGISLIGGLNLNEQSVMVLKNQVTGKQDEIPGELYVEFDIPNRFLTVDIINEIRKLN